MEHNQTASDDIDYFERGLSIDYRHPCVATEPIMFYFCLFFIFFYFFYFLFTVRSQKLPDRFSPNFQELCILV